MVASSKLGLLFLGLGVAIIVKLLITLHCIAKIQLFAVSVADLIIIWIAQI